MPHINLNKDDVHKVLIGLGWDINVLGNDFDLDASAFLLDASDKVIEDHDVVFYGNLKHPSGCVQHRGDNLSGGKGDEIDDSEQIDVDLDLVPNYIKKIVFVVTIYKGVAHSLNFGLVSNAYIRVVNRETDSMLVRFDLTGNYSDDTAIIAGELVRDGKDWAFNSVGKGYKNGMEAICDEFGVEY